ncbi:MAG: hypothetical protein Q7S47_01100 [bacterium]|nr:hypothetical protein [bacterium]
MENHNGTRIAYLLPEAFDYVQRFYFSRIHILKKALECPLSTKRSLALSKLAFNLQRYLDDMTHFGYAPISQRLQSSFKQTFGDKNILQRVHKTLLRNALESMNGQYLIGENSFTINRGTPYYRTLSGFWYRIPLDQVHLLLPPCTDLVGRGDAQSLERDYKPILLDALFKDFCEVKGSSSLKPYLFSTKRNTTPDEYYTHVVKQIQHIISSPVSFSALTSNIDRAALETIFKVSSRVIPFVQALRNKKTYPLYLLRDGMMFSDAHTAINILKKENIPFNQLLIGRKLLSTSDGKEQYWNACVDVLYSALKQHPAHFESFYKSYARLMDKKCASTPELMHIFSELSSYIKYHIPARTTAHKKIVIVDTGLQGSVNMTVKYIIDHLSEIKKKGRRSDIAMFVVGEWFKGIYRGKFASDYYPMMKDIEVFSRSEHIYSYIPNSLRNGKLSVTMGSTAQQYSANQELIILVMLACGMHKRNLL